MFCLVISKVDQGYKKHFVYSFSSPRACHFNSSDNNSVESASANSSSLVSLESEGRNSIISAWPWLTEGVRDRGSGTLGQ